MNARAIDDNGGLMTEQVRLAAGDGRGKGWGMFAAGIALALVGAGGVWAWQGGKLATSQAEAPAISAETTRAIAAGGFDAAQRKAIDGMIEAYLLANPEILPRAMERLQAREQGARIGALQGKIDAGFKGAYAGSPVGDAVVVMFSDFACGYCRQTVADVAQLVKDDPNVKIVFREMPILSQESVLAAEMALAAADQGKYFVFYQAMFAQGRPSAATIDAAAKTAGLDMKRAAAFIATGAAKAEIQQNMDYARQLQFDGTPSFVIGNEAIAGAVGIDRMKAAVAAERAAKAKS